MGFLSVSLCPEEHFSTVTGGSKEPLCVPVCVRTCESVCASSFR